MLGWLCAFALAPASVDAAERAVTPELAVQLVSEQDALQPGTTQSLGLLLEHTEHWHTYWQNAGDSGIPTVLEWTLPAGLSAGDIQWPAPQRFELAGIVNHGFDGRILLPIPVVVDATLASAPVEIAVKLDWLVCKEECIPGSAQLALKLPVREAASADPRWQGDFAAARARLPVAVDWPARFTATAAGEFQIEIDVPAELDLQSPWQIYPVLGELLATSAPSERSLRDGLLRWTQAQSEFLSATPEAMELVLTEGAGAPSRAFAVRAVAASAPSAPPALAAATSAGTDGEALGLLTALLFALLGGIILNLMPCVFPVLALKALALRHDQHGRRHAVFYTAGVLSAFLTLAVILLALRAAGAALGWGFQLQEPGLVAALAYLFFAMGLSLSGLYSVGERWMGVGQALTEGEGDRAAFFTGLLAAVVASPCTAPLMASAIGYALTQPAWVALSVFAALGLGLALPFAALSFIPALRRFLPRPGAWMDTFKQVMAFPLYLSAVWLMWVYGEQLGTLAMAKLAVGAVSLAFVLWLSQRIATAWLRLALLAAGVALCAWLAWPTASPAAATVSASGATHVAYDAKELASLRREGKPVLVNMTAAWCITCLANEKVALSTTAVQDAMRAKGVVYVKGDWTRRDADITRYLASYGRSGVPLYVLYPPGGDAQVLPQLLTESMVLDALDALPAAAP